MKKILAGERPSERGFTLLEVLVVVVILGVLAAVVILNVLVMMNEGEDEAKLTELHNLQTAVYTMMVQAKVSELDNTYTDIDELAEVEGVTARGNVFSLDDFLTGDNYPLKRAYDIAIDGKVSISE